MQLRFWGLQISLSSCSGETEDWGCAPRHMERPALNSGTLDLRRTETHLGMGWLCQAQQSSPMQGSPSRPQTSEDCLEPPKEAAEQKLEKSLPALQRGSVRPARPEEGWLDVGCTLDRAQVLGNTESAEEV